MEKDLNVQKKQETPEDRGIAVPKGTNIPPKPTNIPKQDN